MNISHFVIFICFFLFLYFLFFFLFLFSFFFFSLFFFYNIKKHNTIIYRKMKVRKTLPLSNFFFFLFFFLFSFWAESHPLTPYLLLPNFKPFSSSFYNSCELGARRYGFEHLVFMAFGFATQAKLEENNLHWWVDGRGAQVSSNGEAPVGGWSGRVGGFQFHVAGLRVTGRSDRFVKSSLR